MPAKGVKSCVFSYPEEWRTRKIKVKRTWLDVLHIGIVAAENPSVMMLLEPILAAENSKDGQKVIDEVSIQKAWERAQKK